MMQHELFNLIEECLVKQGFNTQRSLNILFIYSDRSYSSEQEYIYNSDKCNINETIIIAYASIIELDKAIMCNTVQRDCSAHAKMLLILFLLGVRTNIYGIFS